MYTRLLDKIILEVIKELTPAIPYLIKTVDILNRVSELWQDKGIGGVSLNEQKIGMAMQRLGYKSYRNGKLRSWIIEEIK